MKKITVFCLFTAFYACNTIKGMEIKNSNYAYTTQDDYMTGKAVITHTKQCAAMGSVASGFAFFTATAARHMHWPYWIKRAPLFGFISFNAIGQIPTITGMDQDPKKTTFVGQMFNYMVNGKRKA